MSIALVMPARLGHGRMPERLLMPLAGAPVLAHTVSRLQATGWPLIVVPSPDATDDPVAALASALGATVHRSAAMAAGDVLAAVIDAAEAHGLTEIALAWAEHPAVDLGSAARIAALRRRVQADHAMECGLPHGGSVEVVTLDALRRAASLITDPYDRRHVTSFIRRDPRFNAMRAVAPGYLRRPGLRLLVDTPEDVAFMDGILSATATRAPLAPLDEIIGVAESAVVRLERVRAMAERKGA